MRPGIRHENADRAAAGHQWCDNDQRNNALFVEQAGGGWIMEQATISPPSLANRLASLFGDPATLEAAAAAAKSLGQPLAVQKLADLVEDAGRGTSI